MTNTTITVDLDRDVVLTDLKPSQIAILKDVIEREISSTANHLTSAVLHECAKGVECDRTRLVKLANHREDAIALRAAFNRSQER
jgi:hypothetical protein